MKKYHIQQYIAILVTCVYCLQTVQPLSASMLDVSHLMPFQGNGSGDGIKTTVASQEWPMSLFADKRPAAVEYVGYRKPKASPVKKVVKGKEPAKGKKGGRYKNGAQDADGDWSIKDVRGIKKLSTIEIAQLRLEALWGEAFVDDLDAMFGEKDRREVSSDPAASPIPDVLKNALGEVTEELGDAYGDLAEELLQQVTDAARPQNEEVEAVEGLLGFERFMWHVITLAAERAKAGQGVTVTPSEVLKSVYDFKISETFDEAVFIPGKEKISKRVQLMQEHFLTTSLSKKLPGDEVGSYVAAYFQNKLLLETVVPLLSDLRMYDVLALVFREMRRNDAYIFDLLTEVRHGHLAGISSTEDWVRNLFGNLLVYQEEFAVSATIYLNQAFEVMDEDAEGVTKTLVYNLIDELATSSNEAYTFYKNYGHDFGAEERKVDKVREMLASGTLVYADQKVTILADRGETQELKEYYKERMHSLKGVCYGADSVTNKKEYWRRYGEFVKKYIFMYWPLMNNEPSSAAKDDAEQYQFAVRAYGEYLVEMAKVSRGKEMYLALFEGVEFFTRAAVFVDDPTVLDPVIQLIGVSENGGAYSSVIEEGLSEFQQWYEMSLREAMVLLDVSDLSVKKERKQVYAFYRSCEDFYETFEYFYESLLKLRDFMEQMPTPDAHVAYLNLLNTIERDLKKYPSGLAVDTLLGQIRGLLEQKEVGRALGVLHEFFENFSLDYAFFRDVIKPLGMVVEMSSDNVYDSANMLLKTVQGNLKDGQYRMRDWRSVLAGPYRQQQLRESIRNGTYAPAAVGTMHDFSEALLPAYTGIMQAKDALQRDDMPEAVLQINRAADAVAAGLTQLAQYFEVTNPDTRPDARIWYYQYQSELNRLSSIVMYFNWLIQKNRHDELMKLYVLSSRVPGHAEKGMKKPDTVPWDKLKSVESYMLLSLHDEEEQCAGDRYLFLAGFPGMQTHDVAGWLLRYINQVLTYGVTYENAGRSLFSMSMLTDEQASRMAEVLAHFLTLDRKELLVLLGHYGIDRGEITRADMPAFTNAVTGLLCTGDALRDTRFSYVVLVTLQELLARETVDDAAVKVLLQVMSVDRDSDVRVAALLAGYQVRKGADPKIVRMLEKHVQTYAPSILAALKKSEEAANQFQFHEAIALMEDAFEDPLDAKRYAGLTKGYLTVNAAWKKYLLREFDQAVEMIDGVLASLPSSVRQHHPANKMSIYIRRIMHADALLKQRLIAEAQGELEKAKGAGIADPLAEKMYEEIREVEALVGQAQKYYAEGYLAEASQALTALYERGYYGEQICRLLWDVARAYFDRASAAKEFMHVERMQDYEGAEDLAHVVAHILEKRRAAFSEVGHKAKAESGKKNKRAPSVQKKQFKSIIDTGDVAVFQRQAHAYAIREKLRLDEKMLEKVMLAEQALLSELGAQVETSGNNTVLPRVSLYYHLLLPSDEYEYSCDVRGVARMSSQHSVLDLEKGNFQVGDIYTFYGDIDAKEPIKNATFEIVAIERDSMRLKLQNAERKTQEEIDAIFNQLPNAGRFERLPHSSEYKQWFLAKELLKSLEQTIDDPVPSTGHALVDQTLGLFYEKAAVPQPLILGPAGAGKTTGVILSALRKLLEARQGEGTYSIGVNEKQLDPLQKASVGRIADLVASVPSSQPLKIRITAKTNDAVDVIGAQLKKAGITFIRLGNNEDSINDEVRDVWMQREALIAGAEEAYDNGESIIVLSTVDSLSSDVHYRSSSFFNPDKKVEPFFDVTIADEAPMLTWMETLIAHVDTKSIACIGDWTQLRSLGITDGQITTIKRLVEDSPRIRGLFNPTNREHYSISLFEKFYKRPHDGMCREQLKTLRRFTRYLADTVVARLYKRYDIEVYGDVTKSPKPQVGSLSVTPTNGYEGYVEFSQGAESYCNISEVETLLKKVEELLNRPSEQGGVVNFSDITTITYYNAQVKLLQSAFRVKSILREYAYVRPDAVDERILNRLERDMTRMQTAYEATADTLEETYKKTQEHKERIVERINTQKMSEQQRKKLQSRVHFLNKQMGFLMHSAREYAELSSRFEGCFTVLNNVRNGTGALSDIFKHMPLKNMRVGQNNTFPTYTQFRKHPFFISSVDGSQGAENGCVLLSFVRNNTRNEIGFLRNWNRLLVSLSRMRKELHMVGSFGRTLTNTYYQMPPEKYVQDPRKRALHAERKDEVDRARSLFQFLGAMPEKLSADIAMFDGTMPDVKGYYREKDEDEYGHADELWQTLLSFFGAVWTQRIGSEAYDAFMTSSKHPESDMMAFIVRYMFPCMSFSIGRTADDVSPEFAVGIERVLGDDFDEGWLAQVLSMRAQPDLDLMRRGFEKMLAVESLPPQARELITALTNTSNRELSKWWDDTAPLVRLLFKSQYAMGAYAESQGDVLPEPFMDAMEMEAFFLDVRKQADEAFDGVTTLRSA